MSMEDDHDEEEKVAERKQLVVKAVPKKERIGGKRLNPEITPSFLSDKNKGYTYF